MIEELLSRFASWYGKRPNWGRTIGRQGDPYLHRFKLLRWPRAGTSRYALFLHNIVRSDADLELHDHPFQWSLSFVLVSGYIEQRLIKGEVVVRDVKPFRFNYIHGTTFHRLSLRDGHMPTWTLFLHGPRTKTWGFLDTVTGVFKEYVGQD